MEPTPIQDLMQAPGCLVICGWCGRVEDETGCPVCENENYNRKEDYN